MIVVDANVLLYATFRNEPHHQRARHFWEDALSGDEDVALPWTTVLAFLRIGTNPRIQRQPLTIEEAVAEVWRWFQQRCVKVLPESREHADHFLMLLTETHTRGDLVMDAHLAAIAMRHGATLVSFDQDFRRFPGLRWIVPPPLH